MIEYKDIEKIVYLIPARNFYDGLTDSKKRSDWVKLKRLITDYESYLAGQVDVKRKLLWFGLLRRSKEEMEMECLKLIERFHLEGWM